MPDTTLKESVKIVLVDDHLLFRQSLESLLAACPEIEVVGKAGSAREGINLVERLRPDVVILDISMDGMSGLEAAPRIREMVPMTEILILSMHDNPNYVYQAFKVGCRGYVLKSDSAKELKQAIMTTATGRAYFSPGITTDFVNCFIVGTDMNNKSPFMLTPREQEICNHVMQGRSTDEMAADLCISPKTIRVHVANVMKKLSCRSRSELILKLQEQASN
ncbi:MAG: response regulator transcription factor [Desulfobulbaceae bacterium]|nr:response regulator transcription factor [Desulfobulbaceae bacterium]